MSSRKRQSGSPETQARKKEEKRRRAVRRRRLVYVQVAVVLAIAVAVVLLIVMRGRQADRNVHDLSVIGQGVPAVVQVHDVTCPICITLRENVEVIERDYDEDTLLIRVADIRTQEGLAFVARYTDERWRTLLFLDGEGNLVNLTTGPQSVGALRQLFNAHAAAF